MYKIFARLAVLSVLFVSTASFAQSWKSWEGVVPFPAFENIDFSSVRSVKYNVYDLGVIAPSRCKGHCFRVDVIVNGQLFATIPTSPGARKDHWGGRTPLFNNTSLARGGYKGYRLHGRGYHSSIRQRAGGQTGGDNLRWFTVFKLNDGRDVGIGFHGDKDGAYRVTGAPASHGCMRLTDANAKIVNFLARAVIDNTGSANAVRITTRHTKGNF